MYVETLPLLIQVAQDESLYFCCSFVYLVVLSRSQAFFLKRLELI